MKSASSTNTSDKLLERLREELADAVMVTLRERGVMWSNDADYYSFKGKLMDLFVGRITV